MPDFGRTHLYRADPDIVLRLCQRRCLRPISPICLCPWSKGASYAIACPDPGIWALCKEIGQGRRACAPEWHAGCTSPIAPERRDGHLSGIFGTGPRSAAMGTSPIAPERRDGHLSGILGLSPGAHAMGTSPNDPERTRWALLRDFRRRWARSGRLFSVPAGRRYDGGHAESPSMSVPCADPLPAWAEALFG